MTFGHTALTHAALIPVVGSKDGGLHLPLGNDIPDAGQPVSQQEEAPHEQDQDKAAVLRIPGNSEVICVLFTSGALCTETGEYINVDVFTHYSLSNPIKNLITSPP